MAGYRVVAYRPARPYRRRPRYAYRLRSRKQGSGAFPVVVITGAVLLAGAGVSARAVTSPHGQPKPAVKAATGNGAAAQVIAFASARVGKVPYAWGGTTDAGMDCSGLAQAAYAAAGVSIERTSQEQWASEKHVAGSEVTAGDLVFFAGSDGTTAAPGHVGLVVNQEEHQMIDEYGVGTYARRDTYGLPSSAPGLGAVAGFTDPDPAAPPAPAAVPAGSSETAYFSAVLADLGDRPAEEDLTSLAAWAAREGPWGTVGHWNPLDTTLATAGSWNYNTFGGGLHVQNYPSAAEGAQATAATISGGYPLIAAALRSGTGVCGGGLGADLWRWSGDYQEIC